MNQPMPAPLTIAVLVSGNGSNLQVLIDAQANGTLPIQIVGVISNKADAYALKRAHLANIPTFVFDKDDTGKRHTRKAFEQYVLQELHTLNPDLVVLAGFMKILSGDFVRTLNQAGTHMINLHPSLLPAYKGLHTHERVLATGEQMHGCSVHMVDETLDGGRLLTQAVTLIRPNDTPDTLKQRVHTLEHRLLPDTLRLIAHQVIGLDDIHAHESCYRFFE